VPWVSPEHGAFLHRCRDARCSAFKAVAHSKTWQSTSFLNLKTCEQSVRHLFIDI
jgi:hypothetical protein